MPVRHINASSVALARAVTAISLAVALLLAAALPALFLWSTYQAALSGMGTEADLGAALTSDIASRQPGAWMGDRDRIEAALRLVARGREAEVWTVHGAGGELLLALGGELPGPLIRQHRPIHDGPRLVGELTLTRSMRGRVHEAAMIAGVAAILGLGAFLALRRLPLRLLNQALDRASHLGLHDPLTGLPNRTLFNDRLSEALAVGRRDSRTVALLCLDLDRFKDVNDTLGHPIGDALLRMTAQRLQALLRRGDTLARLGGDEFAIIMPRVAGAIEAERLARRLIDAQDQPFQIEGHTVSVGLSVGIALLPPLPRSAGSEQEAGKMLRDADVALYEAKTAGRHTLRFFDPELDTRIRDRRRLEQDLQAALDAGNQFRLVFQPLVDLNTGEAIGAEALIRWRHPERGDVPPARFIPIAEESSLIAEIGRWVLREACRQAALWPRPLSVAVNVSPMQFRFGELEAEVGQALGESGLDPARLELEITEGALLARTEHTLMTLSRLGQLGISIAMDDFGTGYSSLGHLQRFRFDKIKVDRSFVQNLGVQSKAEAIIRAVVGIGRALGAKVVAEGVESLNQAA
ncbi:MAG TPA: EAL domain-containing protein, partial [Acetobacteraceae bacterium]|nr:EAL domain-containing protein [Acetobacteraceae bacterium]